MESIRDENTLLSVTDSIVSLTERPDLIIGDDLGQFKKEYVGGINFNQTTNYTRDDGKINQRGIPKDVFRLGYAPYEVYDNYYIRRVKHD